MENVIEMRNKITVEKFHHFFYSMIEMIGNNTVYFVCLFTRDTIVHLCTVHTVYVILNRWQNERFKISRRFITNKYK